MDGPFRPFYGYRAFSSRSALIFMALSFGPLELPENYPLNNLYPIPLIISSESVASFPSNLRKREIVLFKLPSASLSFQISWRRTSRLTGRFICTDSL